MQRHRLGREGLVLHRETQSMAFLSTPGIDQLYSGETMITPSAARMASARRDDVGGNAGSILRVGIVQRKAGKGRRRRERQLRRRQPGSARATEALKEALRSEPQITSTLYLSAH